MMIHLGHSITYTQFLLRYLTNIAIPFAFEQHEHDVAQKNKIQCMGHDNDFVFSKNHTDTGWKPVAVQ